MEAAESASTAEPQPEPEPEPEAVGVEEEEEEEGSEASSEGEGSTEDWPGDGMEDGQGGRDVRQQCMELFNAMHATHVLSAEPYEEWLERNHIPAHARRMLTEQEEWSAAKIDAKQDERVADFDFDFNAPSPVDEDPPVVDGTQFYSLGLLSMQWKLRRNAVWLSTHPLFERAFMLMVVLSAASLVLDNSTSATGETRWLFPARWVPAAGVGGCTHGRALNTNQHGLELSYDDGSCLFGGVGCKDSRASNYDVCAVVHDQASCVFDHHLGECMATESKRMAHGRCVGPHGRGAEYVRDGLIGARSVCRMQEALRVGCMNPDANNFDRDANAEIPGSCGHCSVRWSTLDATISRDECATKGRISIAVLQEELDWWLLLAFSAEVIVKIVSFGFARGPNTYLSVGWNLLDLWVVLTSWVPYIVGESAASGSVWRTFRLLRPLRTVQRFPGLRRLVETLYTALPQLGSLISLLALFFTFFGVIGVQLWSGRWKQRCYGGDGVLTEDFCDIDELDPVEAGCTAGLHGVNSTGTCSYADLNPYQLSNSTPFGAPSTDFVSFDSVLTSLMIVSHLVTLSSWSEMMHITEETSGWASPVYFVSAVLVGGYLTMTLFVCVLKENFDAAAAVKEEGAAAFLKIDLDGSGELDQAEVGKVFFNHGLYLSEEQVAGVFDTMDLDHSGTVGIDEFLSFLAGNSDVAVKLRKKMGVDGVQDFGEDDDVLDEDAMLESIKHKLTQLATLRHDADIDWSVLFDYYDTDGNRQLTLREFRAAIRRDAHVSTKHMSDQAIAELFAEVDGDASGTIDMEEFGAWMQSGVDKLPPIEEQTKTAVDDALVRLAVRRLHIQRHGDTDPATQVRHALKKANAPEIVSAFALKDTPREIFVNYQAKLTARMPGGFRGGSYSGHAGPRVVTVTSKLINPLIGHSLRIQCRENLVQIVGEYTQRPVEAVCSAVTCDDKFALSPIRAAIRSHIIFKPWFNYVFLVCIVANVSVMCINHHGIPPDLERKMDLANHGFTLVFATELALKAAGQTVREFWQYGVNSGINCFEAVIVLCGLIELLQFVGNQHGGDYALFSLARFLRVLRVFRLVTIVPKMRQIVDVLVSTASDLVYVCMLILIVLFVYSMLGMQLFGDNLTDVGGISSPRSHWDSPMIAVLTTFQLITLDGWSKVLRDTVNQMGMIYILYFVSWIFIGAFVLMKLLLVIILEAYAVTQAKVNLRYAEYHNELAQAKEPTGRQKAQSLLRSGGTPSGDRSTDFQHNPAGELMSGDSDTMSGGSGEAPSGEIRNPLERHNSVETAEVAQTELQQKARDFISNDFTQIVYIFFILFNCFIVALDKPWLGARGLARSFVDLMALFFFFVFGFEVACKVYGFGFYKEPTSYLNPQNKMVYYNRLDFFLFVTSIFDILVAIDGPGARYLRLLRAFRALRLLAKVRGLRKLIGSVLQSASSLWAVVCVMMVVWLVFALAAVHIFKGALDSCTDDSAFVYGTDTCVGSFLHSDGSVAGRTWHAPPVNYDNVPSAFYSLFETAISQEWIEHAITVMDSTAVGVQPMREARGHWGYFFAVFIIVNRVFLLNLCTACVYAKYLELRQQGLERLTRHQKDWLMIMQSLPLVSPQKSQGHFKKLSRTQLKKTVTDPRFELAINIVVCINIVGMAMKYDGEPTGWTIAQDVTNFVCTCLFTAEMVMKIMAFGIRGYFAKSYNRAANILLFAVVVASWLEVVIVVLSLEHVIPSVAFRLIRIVRVVGRVSFILQAVQKERNMKHIADTLTTSLSGLAHLLILVIIVLYVFGVCAMNEFGNVVIQNCLTDYRNFQNVPRAGLTLFGVATGDDFSCVVHSVMLEEDLGDPDGCRNDPGGSDNSLVGTCGNPTAARVFFVLFQFVFQLIVIHLFVNVVLAKFEQLSQLNALPVTKSELDAFVAAWRDIDVDADGKIPVSQVPELLTALPRAIGYDQLAGEDPIKLHELRLPERDDGRLSRFVVASEEPVKMVAGVPDAGGHKTAHKVRDKSYPYVPPGVPLTEVEGEYVGFYEVLYGLVERKAGTPLPNSSKLVQRARRKLSRRMPTVQHVHNSKKWTNRPGNPEKWISQLAAGVQLPQRSEDDAQIEGQDGGAKNEAQRAPLQSDDDGPVTFDVEPLSPDQRTKRTRTKEEKEVDKLQQQADKQRAREEKAAAKRKAKREKVRTHRLLSGSWPLRLLAR